MKRDAGSERELEDRAAIEPEPLLAEPRAQAAIAIRIEKRLAVQPADQRGEANGRDAGRRGRDTDLDGQRPAGRDRRLYGPVGARGPAADRYRQREQPARPSPRNV